MPVRVNPEGTHALFAIDPGETTGIAAGFVELRSTVKETLATLYRRKAVEVSGNWLDQGDDIADKMIRFLYAAQTEEQVPIDRVHFVFEDFVLRLPANTTNLTSIWVAAAACAYFGKMRLDGFDVAWQQASEAKRYAKDERLRLWGLWEVGSAHKRDAWRHFAKRVETLLR